ncbi:hypothetical protein [Lactobacillus sp. Sy-1]|uniref:hypothetical protein n=1 Tax=Lactobacillus sp. Sy-1 TaxID=2109645 RepID=UPI001C5BBEC6|nr:hypothetical protein [Lactobacillus sp. Sy-1]MBW1606382.1 hypothetical protein [Lactobacillus sp. Sy-1]
MTNYSTAKIFKLITKATLSMLLAIGLNTALNYNHEPNLVANAASSSKHKDNKQKNTKKHSKVSTKKKTTAKKTTVKKTNANSSTENNSPITVSASQLKSDIDSFNSNVALKPIYAKYSVSEFGPIAENNVGESGNGLSGIFANRYQLPDNATYADFSKLLNQMADDMATNQDAYDQYVHSHYQISGSFALAAAWQTAGNLSSAFYNRFPNNAQLKQAAINASFDGTSIKAATANSNNLNQKMLLSFTTSGDKYSSINDAWNAFINYFRVLAKQFDQMKVK